MINQALPWAYDDEASIMQAASRSRRRRKSWMGQAGKQNKSQ